jgi:hypothetical protein
MNRSSLKLAVCAFLLIGFGGMAGPGMGQKKDPQRGFEVEPTKPGQYGKCWAVLVGINYRETKGPVRLQLETAENDAAILEQILKTHYGYTEHTVKRLSGPAATRGAILRTLEKILDQTTEEDCVLFFFAGHGNLRRSQATGDKIGGLLYPSNVQFLDPSAKGKRPEPSQVTCIKIGEDLLDLLRENGKARHKLVILDCCHAGAGFGPVTAQTSPPGGYQEQLFRKKVCQMITSARSDQTASDRGKSGKHSPFTQALLAVLADSVGKGNPVTAQEVFSQLGGHMVTEKISQEPLFGTVDGSGAFYLFPSGKLSTAFAEYVTRHTNDLTLLTGLNGGWWFDEFRFLVPGIRYEMGKQHEGASFYEPGRNGGPPNVAAFYDRLKPLAFRYLDRAPGFRQKALNMLMAADTDEQFRLVIKEFEDNKADLTPPDWHLLAVLKHRVRAPDANKYYARAITEYGDKDEHYKKLQALCRADLGRWLLEQGNYHGANSCFFGAVKGLNFEEYPYFVVDCMCLGADAWRKRTDSREKRWEMVQFLLASAQRLASTHLMEHHALRTQVSNRLAWACLDRWNVEDAEAHFRDTLAICEKHRVRSPRGQPSQTEFSRLEAEEGLALCASLRGQVEKARTALRKIDDQIDALPRKVRRSFTERAVSARERLADCYVFSTGDAANALRWLEAAVDPEAIRELPPHKREEYRLRLLYKSALAHGVVGRPEEARKLLKQAEGFAARLPTERRAELEGYRGLAEAAAALIGDSRAVPGVYDGLVARIAALRLRDWIVRSGIEDGMEEEAKVDREQLDILVLACRILLIARQVESDPEEVVEDCRRMSRLCQLTVLGSGRATLPHVRRSYNLAVEALHRGGQTREAARFVLESHSGDPQYRGRAERRDQPILVCYLPPWKGLAFWYTPATNSWKAYELSAALTARLRARQQADEADLPAELLKELRAATGPVAIQWADPVLGLQDQDYPFAVPANRVFLPPNGNHIVPGTRE